MNFQVPRLESIGYFAKSLPTAAPESQRDHGADVRRFSCLINTDEVFGTHRAREKRYPNIGTIKLFSHKDRSRTRFFTSKKAKSSSRSFPSKARKRSLQSSDLVTFLAKDASMAIRCASQQPGPSMNAWLLA